MSVCTFIAADVPLCEVMPPQEYPVAIRIEGKTVSIEDGGADDNFYLRSFRDASVYTDMKYAVSLFWSYTEGRAERIAAYIRDALRDTDCVEIWHVWLMDYWEYEDRPVIHKTTVRADDLTAAHIQKIDEADIWNQPDKRWPERPSLYCLCVTK